MTEQYTPTKGELITALVVYRAIKAGEELPSLGELMTPDEARQYLQEAKNGLAEVAAEAWDEGRRAEERAWKHIFDGHPVPEGEMCDECVVENPYRKAVKS